MAHLTDLKWARPIRPIQTVDKKGRDADYSLNSLLLLPSAGSPFIFLFHGGHRLTLLYSTASITNNPTLPLSLLVLIFLFHSKPFANPSPIAPPTIPLCQIHPPHHSNEHGGWRGRHGHQARHDELLRAGGKGGAGHRSGVPRRQHRDAGEDRGHRRLQCGAGGVQEGEGPEADEARDGAFGEGRYDSDEAFAGVSVGVGGWVWAQSEIGLWGVVQGGWSRRCFRDNHRKGVPGFVSLSFSFYVSVSIWLLGKLESRLVTFFWKLFDCWEKGLFLGISLIIFDEWELKNVAIADLLMSLFGCRENVYY